MKNSRLKNSLIAASVAVLAGVLVFSVNAAIGDAPGYNPPGSGVSPIFSGLEVTGDVTAGGQLYVDDIRMQDGVNSYIWNDGGNAVQIYDDLFVYHTDPTKGNIVATGDISAPGSTISGGTITATGTVSGSTLSSLGDISAGGNLWASAIETNDLFLGGDSYFEGTLTADNIEASNINIGSQQGTIGSFYRITGSQSPTSSYTLSCYAYDYMVGCSGYASDEYRGSLPLSETSCKSYSEISTGRVYTRVLCFDPNGIRTGNNPS